jgi:hypothetical protein
MSLSIFTQNISLPSTPLAGHPRLPVYNTVSIKPIIAHFFEKNHRNTPHIKLDPETKI